jgi:hypothetical protein
MDAPLTNLIPPMRRIRHISFTLFIGAATIASCVAQFSVAQDVNLMNTIRAGYEAAAPSNTFMVTFGEKIFFVAVGVAPIGGSKINDARKIACANSRREFTQYIHGSQVQGMEKMRSTVSVSKDSSNKIQIKENLEWDERIREHSEGLLRGVSEFGFWLDGGLMNCTVGTDVTELFSKP